MKKYLLFAAVLAGGAVSAQQNDADEFRKYFQKPPKEKTTALPKLPLQMMSAPKIQPAPLMTYSHDLQNGKGSVYTLQDGMPCVVPKMEQNSMPNAASGPRVKRSGPGAIPNPGLRNRSELHIVPDKVRR